MTETDEILRAAGWDQWTDDDMMQPWIFQADDEPGACGVAIRFLTIRFGRSLAVSIGIDDHGPVLDVRAFDGTTPANVGMSGWNGDVSLTVAEIKGELEDFR